MAGSSPPPHRSLVQFGAFKVDLRQRVLYKHGRKTSLPEKPFQLLAALLEHPNELVSREELQRELWPDHTFVEYDDSLNHAVNKLREVLNDSSRHSRFIETVPRRGYRFVVPIEDIGTPLGHKARSRRAWMGAAVLAALVTAVTLSYFYQQSFERPPSEPGGRIGVSKPALVVLFFDNNTGDASLEWLRTALADLLITDLSQSKEVEVLSTDRVYEILKDLRSLDERMTSFRVVRRVAERAGADLVVLGSFVKAGEAIRINVRLQEAATGKVLTIAQVEGTSESSIFPMVDDLSRRIKKIFDPPVVPDTELDGSIEALGTSSVEAYLFYLEALKMWWQGKEEERIVLLEKAVETDPGFATALLSLSMAHLNLGHRNEALRYGKRALEHSGRLPPAERFFIEGSYYGDVSLETWGRSIEAFNKAIELGHPNRHNVARRYLLLERYHEAIEQFEYARVRGWPAAYSHFQLAQCYAALGEFEKGYQVLQDFLSRSPNNWAGERGRGRHLILWGKLDEALAAFRKADSIRPGSMSIEEGRWVSHVLRDNWWQAENSAKKMAASKEPMWRWFGASDQAIKRLYRGLSREALQFFDQAARAGYFEVFRSGDETYAAHVLLETGNYQESLQRALGAAKNYDEQWAGREGLFHAALAQAQMGRFKQAEQTAAVLLRKAESIPGVVGKRLHRRLLGEIALIRGDANRALQELKVAQSMLAPRALLIRDDAPLPQHVPIWFSLAAAHLAKGEDEEARQWFERITASGTERIWWPLPYVRSFYFLGNICEKRGELEKARRYYQKFTDFWKEGDIDRDRVQDAFRRLQALS